MIWRKNDDGFFATVDRVAAFLFINFIWVMLSISVIGIPFATLGLFAVMIKWVQGKQPGYVGLFFSAIRGYWQKALVIVAIDVLTGAVLVANLSILSMMNAGDLLTILSRGITLFVTAVLLMTNVYIWPLLTVINLDIVQLIKLVLVLVFTYPLQSAGITLVALLPVALALILPTAFVLFVLVSAMAYLASYGTWHILQKHFSLDELETLQMKTASLENKDIL